MDDPHIRRWAQGFRAEAAADDYRIATAGWSENGVVSVVGETDPIQKWHAREMVRDTVKLVALVLAYLKMDGREGAERFLSLQTYDPVRSGGRYLLIFDIGMYRRTQLVVEELRQVDLVDIHEAMGFQHLVIYHCDGSDYEAVEHAEVRQAVLADVRFDFCEDDMRLDFSEFSAGTQVEFVRLP